MRHYRIEEMNRDELIEHIEYLTEKGHDYQRDCDELMTENAALARKANELERKVASLETTLSSYERKVASLEATLSAYRNN